MPIIADPIITLAQAKTFLNINNTNSDAELTTFIASASQSIYNKIGVVSGSPTVSERHDGGGERIVLRNQGPIVSVTSVVESVGTIAYTLTQVDVDSAAGGAYQYSVDLDHGLLVRRASGVAMSFAPGVQNIHVTYVAGYTTVPADIQELASLMVKLKWETQRGSGRPGSGPEPTSLFPLHARIAEILADYQVPGIA